MQDLMKNPFTEQFDKYKALVGWLFVSMAVGFIAIEILFDVPSIDPSDYLGDDLYLMYMIVLSIAAISFMAFFFMLGVTAQVYLMKKTTDVSLKMITEGVENVTEESKGSEGSEGRKETD